MRIFHGAAQLAFQQGSNPDSFGRLGTEWGWLTRGRDGDRFLIPNMFRDDWPVMRDHMLATQDEDHAPGEPWFWDELRAPNIGSEAEYWARMYNDEFAPEDVRNLDPYRRLGAFNRQFSSKVGFYRWMHKRNLAGLHAPTVVVDPDGESLYGETLWTPGMTLPWGDDVETFWKAEAEFQGDHWIKGRLFGPAAHAEAVRAGREAGPRAVLQQAIPGNNMSTQWLTRPENFLRGGEVPTEALGMTQEYQDVEYGNTGNFTPDPDEVGDWTMADMSIALAMAEDGFWGFSGFDRRVHVMVRHSGRRRIVVLKTAISECNARQTGASVWAVLSRRKGHGGRFCHRYLTVNTDRYPTLASVVNYLHDSGHAYNRERRSRSGVILGVWGRFPLISLCAFGHNPEGIYHDAAEPLTAA